MEYFYFYLVDDNLGYNIIGSLSGLLMICLLSGITFYFRRKRKIDKGTDTLIINSYIKLANIIDQMIEIFLLLK